MSAPAPTPETGPRTARLIGPRRWLTLAAAAAAVLVAATAFLPWVTFKIGDTAACTQQVGAGQVGVDACVNISLDGKQFAAVAGPAQSHQDPLQPGVTHINRAALPVSNGYPQIVVVTVVGLALAAAGTLFRRLLFALPAIYPTFMLAPKARARTEWFVTDPSNGGTNNTPGFGYRLATGELFRLSQLVVAASVAVCVLGWMWMKKDRADAGAPVVSPLEKILGVVALGRTAVLGALDNKHPEAKD